MTDHREAKQCLNIIFLSLFFWWNSRSSESVTALMAIRVIQCLLIISSENTNLDQIKFENLINFKSKFQYILFYALLAIFLIYTKY